VTFYAEDGQIIEKVLFQPEDSLHKIRKLMMDRGL